MDSRKVTKQLLAQEDMVLGEGTVEQTRQGNPVTVTKVNMPAVVATVDDLADIDTSKFTTAIVKDTVRGGNFVYDVSKSEENDGGINFNGWIRQYDTLANVKWFGPLDDENTFKKASDAVDGKPVYVDPGNYSFDTNDIDFSNTSFISTGVVTTTNATLEIEDLQAKVEKADFAKTQPMMDFSTETESGKGNLQGITIVGTKLYASRNVKNNDAGIVSYHPEEAVRIYEYEVASNGAVVDFNMKTIDLVEGGHGQDLSHTVEDGELKLWTSGGTPSGDTDVTILDYEGTEVTRHYPNSGRTILKIHWDGTNNPARETFRLLPEFDAEDKSTHYYHATPAVSSDGKYIAATATDMHYAPRKKLMLWRKADIEAGNYDRVLVDTVLHMADAFPSTDYALQGLLIYDEKIYVQYGYTNPKANKRIAVYDMSGNHLYTTDFYPSSMNADDYKYVETEGLALTKMGSLTVMVTALNLRYTNNYRINRLIAHGIGDYGKIHVGNGPSIFNTTSSMYDMTSQPGTWFRFGSWDNETEEYTPQFYVTDFGNPRFAGTYLGMKMTDGHEIEFKPLSYNTDENREILSLRGWKSSIAAGAGIDLYGVGDSINAGKLITYSTLVKFKSLGDVTNVMFTDYGNIRMRGTYLAFEFDDEADSYKKVLNKNSAGMLEIRAKGVLADGAGINIYDEDHEDTPYSIELYAQNSDKGGNIILSDIPTADPAVKGAVWNDGGTLKISEG